MRPGGFIIFDSSVIPEPPEFDPSITSVGVPCTEIARDLGKVMVKNVVALGAMQAATDLFPKESFLATLSQALQDQCALLALNEEAFAWGARAYAEAKSSTGAA